MRPLTLLIAVLLLAGCKKEPPGATERDEAEGHYLKAQSEFLQGNHAAALASYEEVRKLVPNDPRLPAAIGEVYIFQARWPEARLQFQEAVRLDPKRATNWSRLADVQATQGDEAAAQESLTRALALNPSDFNAMEQQARLLQKQAKLAPSESRFEEAAGWWGKAARAAPEYRQGEFYLQGYALLKASGKSGRAEAWLADAADAGIRAPEVYAVMGELRLRANSFAEAIAAYEIAADLAPRTPGPDGGVSGDSTYWEILGRLYTRVEQLDKAEAAFQRAIELEDLAVLHVGLARVAFLREDEAGAKAELDRALATATGEEVRETIELTDLLAEMGRKNDALMLLEAHASAEDGAQDVELQLRTARLAQQLKQPVLVRLACDRALSLDAGVIGCP